MFWICLDGQWHASHPHFTCHFEVCSLYLCIPNSCRYIIIYSLLTGRLNPAPCPLRRRRAPKFTICIAGGRHRFFRLHCCEHCGSPLPLRVIFSWQTAINWHFLDKSHHAYPLLIGLYVATSLSSRQDHHNAGGGSRGQNDLLKPLRRACGSLGAK